MGGIRRSAGSWPSRGADGSGSPLAAATVRADASRLADVPFESEEAAWTTLRTEKSCFVTFLTPRFARGWSVLAANPPKSPARGLLDTAGDGWNKKNPLLRQATRGLDIEPS